MNTRLVFAVLLVFPLVLGASDETPKQTSATLRLELFVNDIASSRDFYTNSLGFSIESEQPGYTAVRLGQVVLGLGEVRKLPPNHYFNPQINSERRGLGTEIVIEVPSLEETRELVRGSQTEVLTEIRKRPWGQSDFRLADPDGYYLRISSMK